jgi:hypothetical protein
VRRAVAALVASAVLIVPAISTGTHPRPSGATPIRASLVPAYEPCTAPDRTHGPPLAFGSCSGPQQVSDYLTVGTPDSNGYGAKSVGSLRWTAQGGTPLPPEDEIVTFTVSFTDVRCQGSTGACPGPGADYAGTLEVRIPVQITDHYNGFDGTDNYSGAGTMQGTFTVSIPVPCAQTSDPAIGSTCSVNRLYLEAIYPSDPIKEFKRNVWEAGQIQVFDGGADGDAQTVADNTLFAVQGIFVP